MIEQQDVLDLIQKSKGGDLDARSKLVEANLPLVKSIVKRFTGRLEYDDLMQLGAIGLIKAISGFDSSFDVRFSTYAVPMITGEIKRFLRDDGAVKVSRAMKSLNYKIIKFVEEYKSNHEKDPSIAEISEAVGADGHDIVFAMESSSAGTSLYAENEDGETSILDKVADKDDIALIDKLLIKELVGNLDEREQKIIVLRYFRDKTQSEVANLLGISQVQVSRIEGKILNKFKETFDEK